MWVYRERTKEEKIKDAIEHIKYLEKELSNEKSYWYKLTTKQKILEVKRYIKELDK